MYDLAPSRIWREQVRRALVDSLPLLQRANKVYIVEVAESGSEDQVRPRLDDVAAHLARHRIAVAAKVIAHAATSPADELISLAKAESADLIVPGAYGHSRIRELVLGGVTQDLLAQAPVCCLFSH
jgi:nucleotide-binding universal stress UspA family protein